MIKLDSQMTWGHNPDLAKVMRPLNAASKKACHQIAAAIANDVARAMSNPKRERRMLMGCSTSAAGVHLHREKRLRVISQGSLSGCPLRRWLYIPDGIEDDGNTPRAISYQSRVRAELEARIASLTQGSGATSWSHYINYVDDTLYQPAHGPETSLHEDDAEPDTNMEIQTGLAATAERGREGALNAIANADVEAKDDPPTKRRSSNPTLARRPEGDKEETEKM